MQKAINTCPDSSSKNISNALEQIISCSLWAEKRADTNTTKTHQQPAQIAEEQAVKTSIWMQYKETNWIYILWEQRWKAWLQICLITEYNLRCFVLSGMLNMKVDPVHFKDAAGFLQRAVVWLFLRRLQAWFQLHLALRGSTSFLKQIFKHCVFKVLSCRNSLNAVLWMLHLKGSFPII